MADGIRKHCDYAEFLASQTATFSEIILADVSLQDGWILQVPHAVPGWFETMEEVRRLSEGSHFKKTPFEPDAVDKVEDRFAGIFPSTVKN